MSPDRGVPRACMGSHRSVTCKAGTAWLYSVKRQPLAFHPLLHSIMGDRARNSAQISHEGGRGGTQCQGLGPRLQASLCCAAPATSSQEENTDFAL